MLEANKDWIETTTFSRVLDSVLPMGKVYIPDGSYREMTEWAKSTASRVELEDLERASSGDEQAKRLINLMKGRGFWRNFKVKYPESNEMYARMLLVSDRLASLPPTAQRSQAAAAQTHLHKAQCNCAYWHGSFGGLYLPHLRNAVFQHLIAAEKAIDQASGIEGPRVSADVGDFNLDARQEVRLENEALIAFIRPATGGHVYELDHLPTSVNLLATLDRRPEPYHRQIAEFAHGEIREQPKIKQEGLEHLLVYDSFPRKALVDHFFPVEAGLEDVRRGRGVERGDFAVGTYLSKLRRSPDRIVLVMERTGLAAEHLIFMRKQITIVQGLSRLNVIYELERLPADFSICFGVEINLAGMAGHASDRTMRLASGEELGMLDAAVDLANCGGLEVRDGWLGLEVLLSWSIEGGLWTFPIQTVSQSEGGVEAVYQSTAVVPHWLVKGDADGKWSVEIDWNLNSLRQDPGKAAENGLAPKGVKAQSSADRLVEQQLST